MESSTKLRLCKALMLRILQLPLILILGTTTVDGYHATSQCVQLGQGTTNLLMHWNDTASLSIAQRYGYWTIGTKKFDVTHVFLDNSFSDQRFNYSQLNCPYINLYPRKVLVNVCPGDAVRINTYAVFQDGVIMNGWLHFEIELTDKDDEIMGIYVQVRDEHFNAVGEYLLDEDEQCPSNTPGLAQPSQYQVLPCSAVGYREPKISHALFMVQPDLLKYRSQGEAYLSERSIARGIHFTWKMSEYWCNRHYRIRPEALILTKKMVMQNRYDPGSCPSTCNASPPYRKAAEYWIFPGWYGAADIKKKNTKFDCSKKAIDYETGKYTMDESGNNLASWFLPPVESPDSWKRRPLKSQLWNDYWANYYKDNSTGYDVWTIQSCQANPRFILVGGDRARIPSFAGRCNHIFRKDPSHDAVPGCNNDVTAPEFQNLPAHLKFEQYTKYVNELVANRTKYCSLPCRPPQTEVDVKAIKSYKDNSGEGHFIVRTTYNSVGRNEDRVERLWLGRKYHAVMCTMWTMFLAPVGIFAARYFKETCMAHAYIGIHVWYWIHFGTALAALWMFLSSISGLWSSMTTWGRSTHPWGRQHRITGYLSTSVFSLLLLLGGFRIGQDASRTIVRFGFMFMHSFCGFLVYFLNVFCIMMSTWIPASPSMDRCDSEGNSESTSRVLTISVAWLAMDITFHIMMTVFQLIMDRRARILRPCCCPFVPLLPPDSTFDFPGSDARKAVGLVYVIVALTMTATTVAIIGDNELNETCKNLTGPSDCEGEHRIYGCSSYVKAYIEYIMGHAEENGSYVVNFV